MIQWLKLLNISDKKGGLSNNVLPKLNIFYIINKNYTINKWNCSGPKHGERENDKKYDKDKNKEWHIDYNILVFFHGHIWNSTKNNA